MRINIMEKRYGYLLSNTDGSVKLTFDTFEDAEAYINMHSENVIVSKCSQGTSKWVPDTTGGWTLFVNTNYCIDIVIRQ